MFEQWIREKLKIISDWFKRLGLFQIKRSLLGIAAVYFFSAFVLFAAVSLACWAGIKRIERSRMENVTARTVEQAAVSLKHELSDIEKCDVKV